MKKSVALILALFLALAAGCAKNNGNTPNNETQPISAVTEVPENTERNTQAEPTVTREQDSTAAQIPTEESTQHATEKTEQGTASPDVTEPAGEPVATEPAETQPAPTQPTQPAPTQPTQPAPTQPTQPAPTQPPVTEPQSPDISQETPED